MMAKAAQKYDMKSLLGPLRTTGGRYEMISPRKNKL